MGHLLEITCDLDIASPSALSRNAHCLPIRAFGLLRDAAPGVAQLRALRRCQPEPVEPDRVAEQSSEHTAEPARVFSRYENTRRTLHHRIGLAAHGGGDDGAAAGHRV